MNQLEWPQPHLHLPVLPGTRAPRDSHVWASVLNALHPRTWIQPPESRPPSGVANVAVRRQGGTRKCSPAPTLHQPPHRLQLRGVAEPVCRGCLGTPEGSFASSSRRGAGSGRGGLPFPLTGVLPGTFCSS